LPPTRAVPETSSTLERDFPIQWILASPARALPPMPYLLFSPIIHCLSSTLRKFSAFPHFPACLSLASPFFLFSAVLADFFSSPSSIKQTNHEAEAANNNLEIVSIAVNCFVSFLLRRSFSCFRGCRRAMSTRPGAHRRVLRSTGFTERARS
jgi:hypothetical protein